MGEAEPLLGIAEEDLNIPATGVLLEDGRDSEGGGLYRKRQARPLLCARLLLRRFDFGR